MSTCAASLRSERIVSQNDLPSFEPPSPALLAAQAQLQALRRVHAAQYLQQNAERMARRSQPFNYDEATPQPYSPSQLPSHLGWHGPRIERPSCNKAISHDQRSPCTISAADPVSVATDLLQFGSVESATISIHPALAGALLRSGHAASGRIWMLLRHLDTEGRGWISIADARKALTDAVAPLRICGWRQLRNLLRQGNEIFWQRTRDRIWLHSLVRVAAVLDVAHFKRVRVLLPVQALCGTIGTVRAHLYAVFHAGREAQPISRETIQVQTGIARSSQRNYEQHAQVAIRPNYAILAPYTSATMTETVWQHGHATFQFTDKHGIHGPRNSQYIARQLPNSYCVKHTRQTSRNNRRLNRALKDLSHSGTTGNGKQDTNRLYFQDVRAAIRVKAIEDAVYWRSAQNTFWYALNPEIV